MARAIDGGVTAVMLREKDVSHAERLELGAAVAAACRSGGALFLVNGDIEAACELAADGVHLGYRARSVAAARAELAQGSLVGRSTHDAAELDDAHADGVDYVTFGPIFDTPSKRGLVAPRGLDALERAVRRLAPMPVIALGGVGPGTVADVRARGAAGVAAIRALLDTPDEAAAARALHADGERPR